VCVCVKESLVSCSLSCVSPWVPCNCSESPNVFSFFLFAPFVTTTHCQADAIFFTLANLIGCSCRGGGGGHRRPPSRPRPRWSRRERWSCRGSPCLTVPAAAVAAAVRLTRMVTLCPW
jgi:hypothetical protein